MIQRQLLPRSFGATGDGCKRGFEIGRTVAGKPVCVSAGKTGYRTGRTPLLEILDGIR
jgi:hypothetical protein